MKIYYGISYDQLIDITDQVFTKCIINDNIVIPASDHKRAELFGDPFPGILKHIVIIDVSDAKYLISHTVEFKIPLESTKKPLQIQNNLKYWYNSIGKFIENPVERLAQLHNNVSMIHGSMINEYNEQLIAVKYIKENSKVLEIGGNVGRNTIVIATIINDMRNLVTLESDPNIAKQLKDNLDANQIHSHIEASALSLQPLIQKGWDTVPYTDSIPEGWKKISTISYDDLVNKYNVDFDTLVADCEGALYYILKDDPNIINTMNTIILENDFHDFSHKEFVNKLFEMKGFKCVYQEAGGWGPCSNFFYEVWQK